MQQESSIKSSHLTGLHLVLVTISLSLAAFMIVLDSSIANVSLPYIAGDLGVSVNQGTWVITSFAVGNAIALPLTGWLTKRIGSVRLMVSTMVLFALFSWLCGAALDYPILVGARFMQGFVGGPLIPLSQSLLLLSYPPEKRNFANAIFLIVIVVAPIAGPILGGWITFNYTWRWIFYINVPIGILAALICWPIMKDRGSQSSKIPCDWIGLFLLTIGVGCLQILLDKGEQLDWFENPVIWMLGIASFVSLTFLMVWEKYEQNPLLDFKLFKIRNFAIGAMMAMMMFMIFYGTIVITPLWLQTQMGYNAYWAGVAVSPMGIFPFLLALPVAKLMSKVRLERLLSFCFFILALTFFWYSSFDTDVSLGFIAFSRLILGVSIAIFFNPLVTLSIQDIPKEKLPSATGLFYFFRTMGISTGTSGFVYLWDRRSIQHHFHMAELTTPYNENTSQAIAQLDQLHLAGEKGKEILNTLSDKQAYMLATNDIFWLSAILCIGLVCITFAFKKRQSKEPIVIHTAD
ncbi:MAG TPA: DHA2 family efflux MFS transporter permease subunit [Rhabdochlamydiaceae bacterium]|nr:DHA2 family efflux MFS transporter permease subunit [Rhabdochlamydiaceae bacterium]